MTSIDDSDNNTENIHADYCQNEFGNPQVRQIFWGEYWSKMQAQNLWENRVAKASEIATASGPETDVRPRIKDN